MEFRALNEDFSIIAQELIETEPELEYIKNSQVTICYLESDQEKKSQGRLIFGQCEKIPDKYKWAVPCDFTITVFMPNVEQFTDDQLRLLLFHELLHVGIEQDGNQEKYFTKPHDVEDFRCIIDRFGIDWSDGS